MEKLLNNKMTRFVRKVYASPVADAENHLFCISFISAEISSIKSLQSQPVFRKIIRQCLMKTNHPPEEVVWNGVERKIIGVSGIAPCC
jgi:hypothetical protein